MRLIVSLLVWFLGAVVTSRGSLALENLALRQQLATYSRLQQRPCSATIRSGAPNPPTAPWAHS
jgi:hypothetical protein